jgi:hypothetical protein
MLFEEMTETEAGIALYVTLSFDALITISPRLTDIKPVVSISG